MTASQVMNSISLRNLMLSSLDRMGNLLQRTPHDFLLEAIIVEFDVVEVRQLILLRHRHQLGGSQVKTIHCGRKSNDQ
jgi:hypothetical protein